jgi:glutamyl/glutaminyl-tRNA synthetase
VRFRLSSGEVSLTDRRWGQRQVQPDRFGDPVLRRRDGIYAYNLAVVADDIADGVSEVVRGADLLDYAAVQTLIWRAFDATPPTWLHAPLILGPDGKKLAKRHASTSIAELREAGWTPRDIWRGVLPWLGLRGDDLMAAKTAWTPTGGPLGPIQLQQAPTQPGTLLWAT